MEGLQPWLAHDQTGFDDGIDPEAVGLSMEGGSPKGDPLLRASLLATIGNVLGSLGQWADARTVVEESVALRAASGDTLSPEFSVELGALAGLLDGVDQNDDPFRTAFPYVALPTDGLTGLAKRTEPAHAPVPQPPAP